MADQDQRNPQAISVGDAGGAQNAVEQLPGRGGHTKPGAIPSATWTIRYSKLPSHSIVPLSSTSAQVRAARAVAAQPARVVGDLHSSISALRRSFSLSKCSRRAWFGP